MLTLVHGDSSKVFFPGTFAHLQGQAEELVGDRFWCVELALSYLTCVGSKMILQNAHDWQVMLEQRDVACVFITHSFLGALRPATDAARLEILKAQLELWNWKPDWEQVVTVLSLFKNYDLLAPALELMVAADKRRFLGLRAARSLFALGKRSRSATFCLALASLPARGTTFDLPGLSEALQLAKSLGRFGPRFLTGCLQHGYGMLIHRRVTWRELALLVDCSPGASELLAWLRELLLVLPELSPRKIAWVLERFDGRPHLAAQAQRLLMAPLL